MAEITAWDGLLVLAGFLIGCLALTARSRRPPRKKVPSALAKTAG